MKKALVLAFAAVMIFGAAAFADMLSGSWSTSICLDPVAMVFTVFDSTLTVNYEVCNWIFGAALGFGLAGWETVEFTADGVLGAFTIGSVIIFDPVAAIFVSWAVDTSISIAGVDIDLDFDMDNVGMISLDVGISGDVGLCTLAITAEFGGYCEFLFEGICFDFGFPFACVEWVDVSACFGCGTFEGICFEIAGIQFAGLDWLIFDFEVCFDDGELGKWFTFTPDFSFGAYDCITLYAVVITTPDWEFDAIDVYGIEIYYEWNGAYFQSVTAFHSDYYIELIHPSGLYWEKICVGTVGDSCCGGGFDFEICVYFDELSPLLFDIGLISAGFGFGIGSNFFLTASVEIDAALGLHLVCLGFDVSF
ncbi:MAG: hypothetical protein JSW65_05790 [Candidatus Bipolaricaulota bacterium]|nr:MAG: hypothetical protein JSW65_05790 [Candidatus Bipolaricaulota bacterium]